MKYIQPMKIYKWRAGIPTSLVCRCPYCQKTPKIDYIVDDRFWKKTIPKKYRTGVICLKCLANISKECFYHIEKIYYACKGITLKLRIEKIYRNNEYK